MDPRYERFWKLAQRLRNKRTAYWYDFEGGASREEIVAAEQALGVALPSSFRWFLLEFGAARLRATIYGVRPDDPDSLTQLTLGHWQDEGSRGSRRSIFFARQWGSQRLLPYGWRDDLCCFDLSRRIDGEYPILFKRSDREKSGERRTRWTFLDWLEREVLQAELNPATIPSDWSDTDAWEYYWTDRLKRPNRRRSYVHDEGGWERHLLPFVRSLEERRPLRILCAGNGISRKPHALAHLGHDVTALDVSPSATRYVAAATVGPDQLIDFFPEYTTVRRFRRRHTVFRLDEERTRERIAREHQPGGRVTAVTADLFDHSPSEPYDLIYAEKVVERLHLPRQASLAEQFLAWLRPGGHCLVQTGCGGISLRNKLVRLHVELAFRDAGFRFEFDLERKHRFVEDLRGLMDHPRLGYLARNELSGLPFPSLEDLLGATERTPNTEVKQAIFWHGYPEYCGL